MNYLCDTTGGEIAAEAVETTFNILQLILSVGVGLVVGVVVSLVLLGIGRFLSSYRINFKPFFDATAKQVTFGFAVLGAWIGFFILNSVAEEKNIPQWFTVLDHAFMILFIVAGTWFAAGMVNGAVKLIHSRMLRSSERRAKRVQTQTQILHRVIVAAIWLLGLGGALLTFPQARTAGASLLASAGVFSVVAGLAAQTTLSNVFAGLQLAFSDSIRVGDIVRYNGDYTSVEEITLTYVVLAVWDGRRIIVPSKLMTTESFENWTRRAPQMLGEVTWEVDWAVPIGLARRQLEFLLRNTDLWDGETGVLQVKEVHREFLLLRAVVSAEDSGTLTDLQNYLREKMVLWIQNEARQAIPRMRFAQYDRVNFSTEKKKTESMMEERLEAETPDKFLPGDTPTPRKDGSAPKNTEYGQEPPGADTQSRTVILSSEELAKLDELYPSSVPAQTGVLPPLRMDTLPSVQTNVDLPAADSKQSESAVQSDVREGHEASLFSGSAKNEERKKAYSGPGKEAFAERNRKISEIIDADADGEAKSADNTDNAQTDGEDAKNPSAKRAHDAKTEAGGPSAGEKPGN